MRRARRPDCRSRRFWPTPSRRKETDSCAAAASCALPCSCRRWPWPRRCASYPVQIEIRLGELSVRTRPILDDQELATSRPLPVVYWEGLARLKGSLSGCGYLEMTGYADRLQM
ncbi:MAG: lipocalin family protein [Candidatus Accumulibacter meliphilus]|uniref:lipocalin family protein n=1 Tax=Candidatus Accumulibacter meliphilus TaxID=2211374 RepID=UPI002FC3362E